MVAPLQAASAYGNALKRAQFGGNEPASGGFADLVKSAVSDAVGLNKAQEKATLSGVARKADTLDVASAINNAELTLQSVVTIRDRVIQAYQEVSRMPI
jgi:flagellar hook-basal body complex protein FliE